MISYPFIKDFNKGILSKSEAIQGRFYLSEKSGLELNSDVLGQVLEDAVAGSDPSAPTLPNKYPLALMMPPIGMGQYTDPKGDWETYRFICFFLKSTFYDSQNQVINPNQMNTSTHSVQDDWHDMKRCAIDYLRAINQVTRRTGLINNAFRLEATDRVISPVSKIGNDRASGVRLDYKASIFIGCEMEDYTTEDLNSIVIPVVDSHPKHKL